MLKALLFCGFIVGVCSQNVMTRSYPDEESHNCKLGKSVSVIACDGDKQIKDEMPVGVTCMLQHGNETFRFTCSSKLDRHKRSWFSEFICDWFCPDEEPPNTPPWVVIPGLVNPLIYIPKGDTSAVVTWTPPKFNDNEDGGNVRVEVHPSIHTNGGRYTEGTYIVFFGGYDTKGYSAFSSITFKVQAIRCNPFSQPKNGVLRCNNKDIVEGTICSVHCYEGYDIPRGERDMECERHGEKGEPSREPTSDCKPIKCNDAPKISHGKLSGADGLRIFTGVYDAECDPGYYPKTSGSATCNELGEWTKVPECHDVEGPTFLDSECPDDIILPIDAANNTAMVDWSMPKGTDNSDEAPIIIEENGYVPPMRFKAGFHNVKYTIKDQTGNIGSSCIFHITIESISCNPPLLNPSTTREDRMVYTCPSLYTVGSTCELSCKNGYPRAGTDKIQCNFDLSGNPTWKWEGFKPFCQETNCTDLSPPWNGAISCAQWTLGQTCQMQCQKGWDIPYQSTGVFTCSTANGVWLPQPSTEQELVPDCSKQITHNRTKLNLPSEFFYYTNSCNSSEENLLQIRNNFIKALNLSSFRDFCSDDTNCDAKFVQVTCGPVSTQRRKRNSDRAIRAASDQAYKVEFVLDTLFEVREGQTEVSRHQELETMLYNMVDQLSLEIDSGLFDIQGLTVDSSPLYLGIVEFDCPKGTRSKSTTPSCVGCSSGYYMDDSMTCHLCPYGSYQSESNSIVCVACPQHTNTSSQGSKSISDCRERCAPGTYSSTGLQPCAKCPISRYQSDYYSTDCARCPPGLRTFKEGATMMSDCAAYDIKITEESQSEITFDSDVSEATLVYWVYTKFALALSIASADKAFDILVNTSRSVSVSLSRETIFTSSEKTASHSWSFVAMVFNSTQMTVYFNGEHLFTQAIRNSRANAIETNDHLTFIGDGLISSPHLLSGIKTAADISDMKDASACLQNMTSFLYDSDFFSKETSHTMLISSKCDSHDECANNPCGNHTCVNKLNAFECICRQGYSGTQCEVAPDYCASDECQNGATCINGQHNYTCQCTYGFSGAFCNHKAVNGQWSDWGVWSECSKTCGDGLRTHRRSCTNPPPDLEGNACSGKDTEDVKCATNVCPKCRSLYKSIGSSLNCSESGDGLQTCVVKCQPGFFFATPPLKLYECGPATNYVWTHETEENPHARLPKCEKANTPEKLKMLIASSTDVPCSNANQALVKETMDERLRSKQCVVNGNCTQEVQTTCAISSRKRRASQTIGITIELVTNLWFDGSGLNFDETINGEGPSSDLMRLLLAVSYLENTTNTLYNESESMFTFIVGGITYVTDQTSVAVTPSVQCPSGKVRQQYFCVAVPAGSYSNSMDAVFCPKGTFQEKPGQMSCTSCPAGTTTEGIGSDKSTDCSITDIGSDKGSTPANMVPSQQNSEKNVKANVAVIVGSVTAAAVVIAAVLVTGILVYKYMSNYNARKVQSEVTLQPFDLYNLPTKSEKMEPAKATFKNRYNF